jgi:nitrate reductase gamma subunit
MHAWLHWFQGPLFWAALTFLVLGLGRRLALAVAALRRAQRRAGDRRIVYRTVWRATVRWLSPGAPLRQRPAFGATSVIFHAAIIVVPLFLAEHIALIRDAIGVSWPALPSAVATWLAVVAVVAATALVIQRLAARATRALSGFAEYALPVAVAVPFVTGLLVAHPSWNPLSYDVMLLLHVASADLLLVLIPVTKLSHVALLPITQLATELAWHFAPDGGEKVGLVLQRGSEPI